MRKIKQILKVLIAIAISWWIFTSLAYNFLWSYTPTFDTYEEQKNFAHNKLINIANNDFAVSLFWRWYWSSKLKSYLTVEKLYPEKAGNDIDILRWIATCYARLDSYEKALPYYQKELEVFREKYFGKDYPEKRIFKPDDRHLAVREEYKRIIQIHNNIATCYVGLGEYDKAIAELQYVISHYSDMPEWETWLDRYDMVGKTYERLANILYKRMGRYDEAIEYFNKAQEEFPDPLVQSREMTYIGDVYLAKGDKEKAIETYRNVVKKFTPINKLYVRMAETKLKKLN